jgi:hypothetical protein
MNLPRRTLLALAAFALPARALAQITGAKPALHIRVGAPPRATMPADFTGLSYESAQLYNVHYFAANNTDLVRAFTGLSLNGVLRLGGNLSDLTRWQSPAGDFVTPRQLAATAHIKTTWEWKAIDLVANADRGGAITPEAIHNLRGFLDATGWKAIYGLNFGSGDVARARDEAKHVADILGDRLIAFQIGNEADLFHSNPLLRDRATDFESYYASYLAFKAAVREAVPHARFGGPDTSFNMQWTELFAQRERNDAAFLSSHHYAMGPAGDPRMTADLLLASNAGLKKQIAGAETATRASGSPFRLTESNSCYLGGQPGVSDTFASALWVADMMLETAQAGYAGVNVHGGGDQVYTPIASDASGTTLRPIYSGMRFAQMFAGAELMQSEITQRREKNAGPHQQKSRCGCRFARLERCRPPCARKRQIIERSRVRHKSCPADRDRAASARYPPRSHRDVAELGSARVVAPKLDEREGEADQGRQ